MYSVISHAKMRSEQRGKIVGTIQTLNAIKPEKLFNMVEIRNSNTKTNFPKFFSICAAGFAMKDGKSWYCIIVFLLY